MTDEGIKATHKGRSLVKVRSRKFWEAFGCSIRGRVTKRDGRRVKCGHRHRTAAAAQKCCDRMQKERPGNCQRYSVHQIEEIRATYQ